MSAQTPSADETRTAPPPASGGKSQPAPLAPAREHGMRSAGSQIGRLILSIGSPLALLTTLMFYFGWVRTQVQAHELGYDAAVLNFSTTDYLLKSVNVLFPIVAAILLVSTAGHAAYSRVLPRMLATDVGHKRLRRIARGMRYLAMLSVAAGACLLAIPATRIAAIPLSLTAAVLFALSGRSIRRQLTGDDPWSAAGNTLALLLLALLLFWDTERLARLFGEQYAYDIAADPKQFAAVRIYSHNDLHIDAVGVTRDVLGGSSDVYRFRYRGLRLMEWTADRFVVINETWYGGRGRVILLKDADTIRIEFVDPY
jgi:hypothetical protein